MDLAILQAFETELRTQVASLRVRYKDSSPSQKFLAALLKPFNPTYSTHFTSTFGTIVYFPSKEGYEGRPRSSFSVLAHEFVHIVDYLRHPVWFACSYLLPQLLGVVFLGMYLLLAWRQPYALLGPLALLVSMFLFQMPMGVFLAGGILALSFSVFASFWFTGWYPSLWLILMLISLAPWPAPWRVQWEMRGYAMTIAVNHWLGGSCPNLILGSIARNFYGPSYYFMSWRGAAVEEQLQVIVASVQDGSILNDPVYARVHGFLSKRGLLFGQGGSNG